MPQFARARLEQQQRWVDDCVDIANTTQLGIEEVREHSAKNGVTLKRAMKDMLGHRNLQIETRLKVLKLVNPQLWAERLQAPAPVDNPTDGNNRVIIEGGLPDNEPPPPLGDDPPEESPAPIAP